MNTNTAAALTEIRSTIADSDETITNGSDLMDFIDNHQGATDLDGVDYEAIQAVLWDDHFSA